MNRDRIKKEYCVITIIHHPAAMTFEASWTPVLGNAKVGEETGSSCPT
jgi:hypothetical protein